MPARRRIDPAAFDEVVIETAPKPRVGRKSQYTPKYAVIAKQLCAMGATNAVLADSFEVTTTTIDNWMRIHPDFAAAVTAGKSEVFDPMIERSMAQMALGYSVDVEEVKIDKDGDEHRYTVRKHFAPNVTAAIFWLKNRQPDRWRDVWKFEHNGKIEVEKLTAVEILAEIRQEMASLGITPGQLPTVGIAPIDVKPLGKGSNGTTKH